MKLINFGSLNIDRVYEVEHFCRAGETLAASSVRQLCGGKGLNQSLALSRAGAELRHAGSVGRDGLELVKMLRENGVDTSLIRVNDSVDTGHAIIQVEPGGQNSIILYGGANRAVSRQMIDAVLEEYTAGDVLVMQNEISEARYLFEKAAGMGMRIFLNASPIDAGLLEWDLSLADTVLINEVEGREITGLSTPEGITGEFRRRFPGAALVLTLGSEGSCYCDGKRSLFQPAFEADAVDTTGAGDTYTGFFIEELLRTGDPAEAMRIAAMAASIAVGRAGAGAAMPDMAEVRKELENHGFV